MLPYWLMFLLPGWAALLNPRLPASQSRWVWTVVAVLIALLIGLRHEIGGDWYTYESQFWQFSSYRFDEMVRLAKDPGYTLLGWLVARAGGDVHLLNLLCAIPLAVGTVRLARAQPRPALALLAAVPYLLIVVGMGYTRQAAAIGFAMIGLVALGQSRQRAFVVWVLLAAAFHKSAVLLLPIAALAATRNRAWSYLWVGAITVVGAWLFVYDSADTLVKNYVVSDYADSSEGAVIRVAMNSVPSVLALWYRKKMFEDLGERRLWSWMAIISLACLPLLAVSLTAVDRIALYFIPLQLVVFARLPRISSGIHGRTLLVIGILLYYATVQFIWLNFAGHSDAWLPYRFMPLW